MADRKELPQAIDHERGLLGSILLYPESMDLCLSLDLAPEEFFLPQHQKIYGAMKVLHEKGIRAEAENITLRLKEEYNFDVVETQNYLMVLVDNSISTINTRNYIEIIKNKALLRNLIFTCQKIEQLSYDESQDLDPLLDNVERLIMEVTRTRRGVEFQPFKTIIERVLAEIDLLKANQGVAGLSTGFIDLDKMTSGLHEGELIIVAARPAMGKSAFALNLAHNVAQKNQAGAVAFFSLEMPGDSLIKRMLACEASIEGDKLKTGKITKEERDQLSRSAARLAELEIFIDDTSYLTVSQIFAKCRKLATDRKKISLIVIDYLQLITSNRKSDNRVQEVSEISRNLKILAKEMHCPVVALSQLSRRVEERTSHEPLLSDLRESGSIEQDADIVMFLYRESYYEKNKDYFGEKEEEQGDDLDMVDLSIAKHRNGQTGKIKLIFEKNYSRFVNADFRSGMM